MSRKNKVLIVDDSKVIRLQINSALVDHGYDAIEADNGEEALNILRKDVDIGMVLVDINMPNISGFELCDLMQKNDKLKSIPAVVLTIEGNQEMIRRGSAVGIKGWLVKPFQAEKLIEVVEKCLSKYGKR